MGEQKARIPLLERDQVSPEIAAVYDALLKQRGAVVGDITFNKATKMDHANLTDPNGVRMELIELPPESPLGQAMARWR